MNGKVCTCWRLKPDGSHGKGCDFAPAMAESNHTTNEGGAMTKGTLTNGTVEIKGTYNPDETAGSISFTPEGAKLGVYFTFREWQFVPDKKPLPEPDNVVIVRSGRYPIVGLHDKWYQVNYNGTLREKDEEQVREDLKKATAIFKSGAELKKEDYV